MSKTIKNILCLATTLIMQFTPIAQAAPIAINLGGPAITGVLADAANIEWQFDGIEGEYINIDLNADFDSYLILYRSNGKVVHVADDDYLSLVGDIYMTLPFTDTYTLKLGNHDHGGAFSVNLYSDRQTVLGTIGGEIRNNETKKVTLNSGGAKYYFYGKQGDSLTISATKPNENDLLDPRIDLFDQNGVNLIYDEDSGGNGNAEIFEYELPETGKYTIALKGFYPISGEVILWVTTKKSNNLKDLPFFSRQRSALIGTKPDYWSFVGKEGQKIQLKAVAKNADLKLSLRYAKGPELYSDSGSSEDHNPLISYTLPEDGVYRVVVSSFYNEKIDQIPYYLLLKEVKEIIEFVPSVELP